MKTAINTINVTPSIAETLIAKAGINKAQANALVAALDENDLAVAILYRDVDALTAVRGIGPKTADKVIANCRNTFRISNNKTPKADYDTHHVVEVIFNPKYGEDPNAEIRATRIIPKRISPAAQYLRTVSGSKCPLIEVLNTIDEKLPIEVQQVQKAKIAEEAKFGIWYKGVRYVFYEHSTNGAKDNHVLFVRDDLLDAALDFSHCGADWRHSKIAPSKFAAYGGLVHVWTKDFGVPVKPEQIAFFPSKIMKLMDDVVFVNNDGSVNKPERREVEQNSFDGFCLFSWNKQILNGWLADKPDDEVKRIKRALSRWSDSTIRAPYVKGLCCASFDVHSFFKSMGVTELTTLDGSVVNIDDIAIFADESVFKAKFGKGKEFSSKADYDANFKRLGHRLGRLVESHADHKKPLCYQHLQMINGASDEHIEAGAKEEAGYINRFQSPIHAANLIGGKEMAQLAHIFPQIMRDVRWFRERAEAGYLRLYREAIGGRVHNATHYSFIAPDPVAFCQHIAGLEVTGCIKANEVYVCGGIRNVDLNNGAEAIMSRIPGTDPGALRVVTVRDTMNEKYTKYFRESSTYFMSVMDTNVTRFRGDFDGDHCYLTFEQWYVDAVKKTHEVFGDYLIDWVAPSAEKKVCTRAVMNEYAAGLYKISDLGSYNLILAKLYDAGMESWEAVAFLTYAINVLVDASKHGGRTVTLPENLKDVAKMLLPKHVVLSKDAKHPATYGEEQAKKTSSHVYGVGTAGQFCKFVAANTKDSLNMNIEGDTFNYRLLMVNPSRNIPELLKKMPRLASFKYVFVKKVNDKPILEQGLWQELSMHPGDKFAGKDENGKPTFHIENKDVADANAARRRMTLDKIKEYAVEHGCTDAEAYDLIIWDMFENNDSFYMSQKKKESQQKIDICWDNLRRVYGKAMVQFSRRNRGLTVEDIISNMQTEEIEFDEDELD